MYEWVKALHIIAVISWMAGLLYLPRLFVYHCEAEVGSKQSETLIGGSGNSYVATLVERHSRYVMLVKVANKDTESVVSALIKQSQRLPSELYRSLTWDRGKELADHQRLTLATEVEVYFCCPRSPWQRGSKRKHQQIAAPVSSARHRSVLAQPGQAQCHRKAAQ